MPSNTLRNFVVRLDSLSLMSLGLAQVSGAVLNDNGQALEQIDIELTLVEESPLLHELLDTRKIVLGTLEDTTN